MTIKKIVSLLLALVILVSIVPTALAQEIKPQTETVETENAETAAPVEDSVISDTEEGETATEPQPIEGATEETPAFVPLAVAECNTKIEGNVGDAAQLSVALNRSDVNVSYRWQKLVQSEPAAESVDAQEETEALFDYEGISTDYFFPIEDMTEAELLVINPDATWAGKELYLQAVEEAIKAGKHSFQALCIKFCCFYDNFRYRKQTTYTLDCGDMFLYFDFY